jgi:hypothetical protein
MREPDSGGFLELAEYRARTGLQPAVATDSGLCRNNFTSRSPVPAFSRLGYVYGLGCRPLSVASLANHHECGCGRSSTKTSAEARTICCCNLQIGLIRLPPFALSAYLPGRCARRSVKETEL